MVVKDVGADIYRNECCTLACFHMVVKEREGIEANLTSCSTVYFRMVVKVYRGYCAKEVC